MQDLKSIIESLLFVADEPLPIEKLKGVLETIDGKEIRSALEELCGEYERRGGGFYLREVAGGWQLRSRPQYHEWIKRLLQPSPQRLSRAVLETLAIIAYKQPIIRADIEHIRGVDCGGVLRQLMERKLIRVLGRKEIAGRPLIYATTKLFLELFDLKDIKDLPSPKEIEELGAELNTPDRQQNPLDEEKNPRAENQSQDSIVLPDLTESILTSSSTAQSETHDQAAEDTLDEDAFQMEPSGPEDTSGPRIPAEEIDPSPPPHDAEDDEQDTFQKNT